MRSDVGGMSTWGGAGLILGTGYRILRQVSSDRQGTIGQLS